MNKLIAKIFMLGCIFFMFGCANHSSQIRNERKIQFSCKGIYIDTTGYDVSILFKIKVSNQNKKQYYFFSNSSIFNRDSVKSNFYLIDTVHSLKYQLLLASGPTLMKLYSEKIFKIPVLMIGVLTWRDLRRIYHEHNLRTSLSNLSLVIEFLKGSRLIYISNKKDFESRHINLKYSLGDSISITFSDETPVYFTIPDVKSFLDDSLLRQKDHYKIFLIK
ncbi:MAG TPA: hypothetical protein VFQ86_06625 [Arachidicoccus soli]|nr:hypothetical protein [Arachidicoccus soli]